MKTNFIKFSVDHFFSRFKNSFDYDSEITRISKTILIKNSKPEQILNIGTVDTLVNIRSGSYFIPEDIIIKEKGLLEIEEGTHLYFAKGKGIISIGKVFANGSKDNMILLSGDEWSNISFIEEKSSDSLLYNTIIVDGKGRRKIPFGNNTFMNSNDFYLGGNVYIENSHVKIRSVVLFNGFADIGGGLYAYDSVVDIENSTILGNEGKYTGAGGISCDRSRTNMRKRPSRITNCFIMGNKSRQAGGIEISCGVMILDNLVIKHNYSELSCGGLKIENNDDNKKLFDVRGNIRLINSTIESNIGFTSGGIYSFGCELYPDDFLSNSIKNNVARYGIKHNIG